jgi:hypothetical protein
MASRVDLARVERRLAVSVLTSTPMIDSAREDGWGWAPAADGEGVWLSATGGDSGDVLEQLANIEVINSKIMAAMGRRFMVLSDSFCSQHDGNRHCAGAAVVTPMR